MSRPRRHGFTLLEVMIALAMISMVLTLAYSSFASSTRIVEERESYTRSLHRADFVLRHLTDQLQSVYLDQAAYYRMDDPAGLFEGGGDRLMFWTLAPAATRRAQNRGGLQQVTYSVGPVETDREPEEGAPAFELRFTAFTELAYERDEAAATWSLPVESVEFEYYDGEGWTGGWDIADEERLPRGIRVTIGMPAGRGDTLEVQTVIPLAVTLVTQLETEDAAGGGGGRGGGAQSDAGEGAGSGVSQGGGSTGGFNPFGSSKTGPRRRDPIAESQRNG